MDPCGALMALQIILQQITLKTKLRQRTEVEGPLDGVMVCTRVQLTRPLTNALKDQCLASSAVRRCGAASHWCAPVRCVNPQTFQNSTKHFSVFLAQSQIPFFWCQFTGCFRCDVSHEKRGSSTNNRPSLQRSTLQRRAAVQRFVRLCCGLKNEGLEEKLNTAERISPWSEMKFFTLPPQYRSLG